MTDEPQRRVLLAALVLLAVVGLAAAAVAQPAAADSHHNDSAYTIQQGDQCIDVDPIVDEDQSAEEFYDYRHPDSEPSATTYSSYGTTAYQKDDASTLLVYEGSQGASLVIIHERLHEPEEGGTNGSSATFTVTGLSPEDDGWVVLDDDYDGSDDEFEHTGTTSEMDWIWTQGRNDGAVYRGLDGEFEIEIDPAFNEAADKRWNHSGYGGQVTDWDVVSATDDGHERIALDSLEENVTISPGHCAAAPTASLTASDTEPEVGASVTLDASGSQSESTVVEYRWDLTGDGTVDRTSETPTVDHAFEDVGQRNVTVTVVAEDGQTDTAGVVVDVGDETPPDASIDAPAEAVAGETIELSASGSTDNHRIASYAWAIENETDASGETVQHAFEEPGEYEVTLTATDPSGNEGTATTTISITEATEPAASLQAPDSATVGESVTLDASGSVTGENATYEWTVDGESVAETTAPTHEVAFDQAGSRQVGVTVTDANGSDGATATVDVTQQLNASLEASPQEATPGDQITFDASASTGNVTRYDWAFGDGATVEDGDAQVEHGYDEPGTYETTLTVHDGAGNTDTTSVTVEITADADGPTAQLDAPGEASVDEPVTLDASGSEVGANATYVWVVDGDSVATTTNATYDHTFGAAGDHEVSVTVTDANGSDEATATVSVAAADDGSGDDGSGNGDDSGGGGGYGGGGGGGYGGPPSDPVETSVAVEDGAIVVTAENVERGESFTVDVPEAAAVDAGPQDRDVLALRSLEVTPAEDADSATITVEPADRSVPGRFATVSAFEPDTDLALESVTYEVGVDREAMAAARVSADELTAYANDGSWNSLETSVSAEDDRIVATATAEGDAPVGIGAIGPVLYVSSVTTDGPIVDGTVPVATTVENTGTDAGEWTIPLTVGGEQVAEHSVALDAGEERTLTASVHADDAADSGVTIASLRRGLAVVAVTELSVTPTEPAPNETATVEATVGNRGEIGGEVPVELVRDGEVVATEQVALDAGEETTVTFEQSFASEGTYELVAGNATASVDVEARDSFEGEDSEVTSDATPGFGTLAGIGAVLAVVVAVLLGRRRRSG